MADRQDQQQGADTSQDVYHRLNKELATVRVLAERLSARTRTVVDEHDQDGGEQHGG